MTNKNVRFIIVFFVPLFLGMMSLYGKEFSSNSLPQYSYKTYNSDSYSKYSIDSYDNYSAEVYKVFNVDSYKKFNTKVYCVYTTKLSTDDFKNARILLNDGTILNLRKVFSNIGVGGGIILVTSIVLPAIFPGTAPATAVLITTLTKEALIGAALESAVQGVVTYAKTRDAQKTIYKSIEGASEGFKWAAVFASGSETIKAIRTARRTVNLSEEVARVNKSPTVTSKKYGTKYKLTTADGGRYGTIMENWSGDLIDYGCEIHHIPAKSTSKLSINDGPSIVMEGIDHKLTASYGASKEATAYQIKQMELINKGKFREAVQMDIDDIHLKFGNKYDLQISAMLKYIDELEKLGKL